MEINKKKVRKSLFWKRVKYCKIKNYLDEKLL